MGKTHNFIECLKIYAKRSSFGWKNAQTHTGIEKVIATRLNCILCIDDYESVTKNGVRKWMVVELNEAAHKLHVWLDTRGEKFVSLSAYSLLKLRFSIIKSSTNMFTKGAIGARAEGWMYLYHHKPNCAHACIFSFVGLKITIIVRQFQL